MSKAMEYFYKSEERLFRRLEILVLTASAIWACFSSTGRTYFFAFLAGFALLHALKAIIELIARHEGKQIADLKFEEAKEKKET